MERHPDESFEDYKIRRAAANKLAKQINRKANAGGSKTSREIQRDTKRAAGGGKIRGVYGRYIMTAFDSRRPDLAKRQKKHAAYLQHQADRKAARVELKLAA